MVLCGFIKWGGAARGEKVERGLDRQREGVADVMAVVEGGRRGASGASSASPGANRFPAALKGLLASLPWNGVEFHLWQITRTGG